MNEEEFLATVESRAEQHLADGVEPAVVEDWKKRQLQRWSDHSNVTPLDEIPSLGDLSEEERTNVLFPNTETRTVTNYQGEEVEVPTQVADTYEAAGGPELTDLLYSPDRQEEREANIAQYEEEQAVIEQGRLEHNIQVESTIDAFQDKIPTWAGYVLPILGLLKKSDKAVELATGIPRAVGDIAQGALDYGAAVAENVERIYDYATDPEAAEYFENNPEAGVRRLEGYRIDLGKPLHDYRYQYAGTAVEDLQEGDYLQGAYRIGLGVVEAVPSIAISYYGGYGGIALLGVSAGGSSYVDTRRAHPELNPFGVFATSSLKGGFEAVSETVTRKLFSIGKGLYKAGGKPLTEKYAANLWKQYAKGFGLEASSETGAELAGHLVDYSVHGIQPPEDMWKQLADTFIISGITGTATVGAGHRRALALRYETTSKKDADAADIAQLDTVVDALGTAKDPEEIASLNQVLGDTITRINERQLQHNTVINDLTKQEIKDLATNNAEILKYERFLKNNPNLSEQAQEIYRNKISEAAARADDVYNRAAQYEDALKEAADLKAEVQEKREKLLAQEKQLAKAENPNPSSTEKINTQKQELNEQDKIIDEKLRRFRPGVSSNELAKKVDTQIKAQKARHQENLKALENQGATEVEVENEIADNAVTEAELNSLKERVDKVGVTKGDKLREDAKSEISNELDRNPVSKARLQKAKKVVKSAKAANALAQLNNTPNSKQHAARVVLEAKGNVDSVTDYLLENSSPKTAVTALESLSAAAMVEPSLTDAEQIELSQKFADAAFNIKKDSSTSGNKEKLDEVVGKLNDLKAKDAKKLEGLVDSTLKTFESKVANKVDAREEIDITEREEQNKIETDKAKRTFNDYCSGFC